MFVVVVCCERAAPAPFSLTFFRMYPARAHVQSQAFSEMRVSALEFSHTCSLPILHTIFVQ